MEAALSRLRLAHPYTYPRLRLAHVPTSQTSTTHTHTCSKCGCRVMAWDLIPWAVGSYVVMTQLEGPHHSFMYTSKYDV